MEFTYRIADPSGNTTALVQEGFPEKLRREAAALLMQTGGVEQVGFLCPPRFAESAGRLEMAGGEFCGNATLSAAVWSAKNRVLIGQNPVELRIECSGADTPLCCAAWSADGADYGMVGMPPPTRIYTRDFSAGGRTETFAVVEMPGITHLLWPVNMPGEAESGTLNEEKRDTPAETERGVSDKEECEFALVENERRFALSGIRGWCEELGAEALGVLLCGRGFERIAPLVYVPQAGTLVWERGCGSGTAALGAYLAKEGDPDGILEKDVRQPGGTIRVRAESRGGSLCSLQISTAVTFSEEKVLQM